MKSPLKQEMFAQSAGVDIWIMMVFLIWLVLSVVMLWAAASPDRILFRSGWAKHQVKAKASILR
jgi:hypothetical protein